MQALLRPNRAHAVRRPRLLPVPCLAALLAAAALAACTSEQIGETANPGLDMTPEATSDASDAAPESPTTGGSQSADGSRNAASTMDIDPDALRAAMRDAYSKERAVTSAGPWHAADDILVAALEPSLASTAHVVSKALEQAVPSVRTTVWVPGDAPVPPDQADVVAALVRATEEDGQPTDAIHLEFDSRLGLLHGGSSTPCTSRDLNPPERQLPVVTFDGSTNVSRTGRPMDDGLAIAAAIYRTLEHAAANTVALPEPPATTGLSPFPVPAPPLAELTALVAGQQPLGVSEALWFLPSDDPSSAMDGATNAAKGAGWTLADRYVGQEHPAVVYLSRRGGCLSIARRDTHVWAHALSSDPEIDAATLLAPTFEAQIDIAPIADLMPYIGLALPEQRRRFFDRAIAERPTDDATLLALATYLHEERGDDAAATNYLEPVARHAWRLESDVAANAIGLVEAVGLVHLHRIPRDIADWEHYGYEVVKTGQELVREVGVRESLALIVDGGDAFDAVIVQVRRKRILPGDPMAYELYVYDRWLESGSEVISWRSSSSELGSTDVSSVRLQLWEEDNWVSAEARQVGPERFELRMRVDAEGELTNDDGG